MFAVAHTTIGGSSPLTARFATDSTIPTHFLPPPSCSLCLILPHQPFHGCSPLPDYAGASMVQPHAQALVETLPYGSDFSLVWYGAFTHCVSLSPLFLLVLPFFLSPLSLFFLLFLFFFLLSSSSSPSLIALSLSFSSLGRVLALSFFFLPLLFPLFSNSFPPSFPSLSLSLKCPKSAPTPFHVWVRLATRSFL